MSETEIHEFNEPIGHRRMAQRQNLSDPSCLVNGIVGSTSELLVGLMQLLNEILRTANPLNDLERREVHE
jgi:hypothetical protein